MYQNSVQPLVELVIEQRKLFACVYIRNHWTIHIQLKMVHVSILNIVHIWTSQHMRSLRKFVRTNSHAFMHLDGWLVRGLRWVLQTAVAANGCMHDCTYILLLLTFMICKAWWFTISQFMLLYKTPKWPHELRWWLIRRRRKTSKMTIHLFCNKIKIFLILIKFFSFNFFTIHSAPVDAAQVIQRETLRAQTDI